MVQKEDTMDAQTIVWLTSVPQFWYGVVACASLVFLALLSAALFPRRTVIIYSLPEPSPSPFKRIHSTSQVSLIGPYLHAPTPHCGNTPGQAQGDLRISEKRASQPRHIKDARKRAIWHPHPND